MGKADFLASLSRMDEAGIARLLPFMDWEELEWIHEGLDGGVLSFGARLQEELYRAENPPQPPVPSMERKQERMVEVMSRRHDAKFDLYHPSDAIQKEPPARAGRQLKKRTRNGRDVFGEMGWWPGTVGVED